jgi:hypothetical protein
LINSSRAREVEILSRKERTCTKFYVNTGSPAGDVRDMEWRGDLEGLGKPLDMRASDLTIRCDLSDPHGRITRAPGRAVVLPRVRPV